MSWYYAEGNEQVGPISKADLFDLVRQKQIDAHTKVWRPGMEQWVKLGQLVKKQNDNGGRPSEKAPAGANVVAFPQANESAGCSECGQAFPTTEMIRFQDNWVCARCKPTFLQKLKEGVQLSSQMDFAGFWLRFAAIFLDGLILGGINFILQLPLTFLIGASGENMALMFTYQTINMLIGVAVPAGYTTWFLGKYAATPGKMACKIKVVRADGSPIGYGRALGRHFAKWLSWMILMIGFIMAAFDDEKRTLHDRICDTRVVKKD